MCESQGSRRGGIEYRIEREETKGASRKDKDVPAPAVKNARGPKGEKKEGRREKRQRIKKAERED